MRAFINIINEAQQLDELQGVKGHLDAGKNFIHNNDVIDYLKERGLTFLGKGVYAAVFDHPSFGGRYVLKVFCDPNYEQFLNFCIKNRGNDHLPKVIGKVMPLGQNGRMVRIEKLRPFSDDDYSSWDMGILTEFAWNMMTKKPAPEDWKKLAHWADRNDLRDFCGTVFDLIRVKPKGARMDLHAGNFMWRDRTLVISDPYSGAAIPFIEIRMFDK
jgi:hypothetical protein